MWERRAEIDDLFMYNHLIRYYEEGVEECFGSDADIERNSVFTSPI
jgi:hypothetical protein